MKIDQPGSSALFFAAIQPVRNNSVTQLPSSNGAPNIFIVIDSTLKNNELFLMENAEPKMADVPEIYQDGDRLTRFHRLNYSELVIRCQSMSHLNLKLSKFSKP
jgi:hypothetical protein